MAFFDSAVATKGLQAIIHPGQVFEVRAIGVHQERRYSDMNAFGVFGDIGQAVDQVSRFCERWTYSGLYYTPNPLKSGVLARRPNKFDIASRSDVMAGNSDVESRKWLLIDIDALRPAGITASDDELVASKAAANGLFSKLSPILEAEPIVFVSGNGYHLMYRIELPTADEELVKNCLLAASKLLPEGVAHVDCVTHNAARIWKLPGSFARKGEELAEQKRMFRMASLVYSPKELKVISSEKITAFAATIKKPETSQPAVRRFEREKIDGSTWLSSHGIGVHHTKAWGGATAHVLEECPFDSQHRTPDSMLLEFLDGRFVFFCFHNSCRGHGWFDLRDLKEPGWRDRRSGGANRNEMESIVEEFRKTIRSTLQEEWSLFCDFRIKRT